MMYSDAVRSATLSTEHKLTTPAMQAISYSCSTRTPEEMSCRRKSTWCRTENFDVVAEAVAVSTPASYSQAALLRDHGNRKTLSKGAGRSPMIHQAQEPRGLQTCRPPSHAAGTASAYSPVDGRTGELTAKKKTMALPNDMPLREGIQTPQFLSTGHLPIARRHLKLMPVHTASGRGAGADKRRAGGMPPKSRRPLRAVRVAIIGAGMAGVSAACALRTAGVTCVTLFEARSRIGGRCCSAKVDSWQRLLAKNKSDTHACVADASAVSASLAERSSTGIDCASVSMQQSERNIGRWGDFTEDHCSGDEGGIGNRGREEARKCPCREMALYNLPLDPIDARGRRRRPTRDRDTESTPAAENAASEALVMSASLLSNAGKSFQGVAAVSAAEPVGGLQTCSNGCTADKTPLHLDNEAWSSSGATVASSASECVWPLPSANSLTKSFSIRPSHVSGVSSPTKLKVPDPAFAVAETGVRSSYQRECSSSETASTTNSVQPAQDRSRVTVANSCVGSSGGGKLGLESGDQNRSVGGNVGRFVVDGIDLGASWIHGIDENPVYKVCLAKGLHPYGAAGGDGCCCGWDCCFNSGSTTEARPALAEGGAVGQLPPLADEALFDEATGQLADAGVDAWAYQTHQRHQMDAERDGGGSRDCKCDRSNHEIEGSEAAPLRIVPDSTVHKTEKYPAVSSVGRKRCRSEDKGRDDVEERLRWMRQRKLLWTSLGSGLNRRLREAVRGVKQRKQQEQQNRSWAFSREPEGWDKITGQTYADGNSKEVHQSEEEKFIERMTNKCVRRPQQRDQARNFCIDDKGRSRPLDTFPTAGGEVHGETVVAGILKMCPKEEENVKLGREVTVVGATKTDMSENGRSIGQWHTWGDDPGLKQGPDEVAVARVEQEVSKGLNGEEGDCVEGRLLMWHLSNLEYSAGADVDDLSMMCWDQDDLTAFQGQHVLIWEGYKAAVEVQARCLDIRLRQGRVLFTANTVSAQVECSWSIDTERLVIFALVAASHGVLKASVEAYERGQLHASSASTAARKEDVEGDIRPVIVEPSVLAAAGEATSEAEAGTAQRSTVAAPLEKSFHTLRTKFIPMAAAGSGCPVRELEGKDDGRAELTCAVVGCVQERATGSTDAVAVRGCSVTWVKDASSEARGSALPVSQDTQSSALRSGITSAGEGGGAVKFYVAAEGLPSPEMKCQFTVPRDSFEMLTPFITTGPPSTCGGPADDQMLGPLTCSRISAAGTDTPLLCSSSYGGSHPLKSSANNGLSDSAAASGGAIHSAAASSGADTVNPSAHCSPPDATASIPAPAGSAAAVKGSVSCQNTGGSVSCRALDDNRLLSDRCCTVEMSGLSDRVAAGERGGEFEEPQDSLHDVPVDFSISERLRPYLMTETEEDLCEDAAGAAAEATMSTRNCRCRHEASGRLRCPVAFQGLPPAGGETRAKVSSATANGIEKDNDGCESSPAAQGKTHTHVFEEVEPHKQQLLQLDPVAGRVLTLHTRTSVAETPVLDLETAAILPLAGVRFEQENKQQRARKHEEHQTCSDCLKGSGLTAPSAGRMRQKCGAIQGAEPCTGDSSAATTATSSVVTREEAEKTIEEERLESESREARDSSHMEDTPSLQLWRMLEKARCNSTRGILQFDPPLPEWKRAAIKLVGMGNMNKIALVFRRPFWLRSAPSSAAAVQPAKSCCSGGTSTCQRDAQRCPAEYAAGSRDEADKAQQKEDLVQSRKDTNAASSATGSLYEIPVTEEPVAAAAAARAWRSTLGAHTSDRTESAISRGADGSPRKLSGFQREYSAAATAPLKGVHQTFAAASATGSRQQSRIAEATDVLRSSSAHITQGVFSYSSNGSDLLYGDAGRSSNSCALLCGRSGSSTVPSVWSDNGSSQVTSSRSSSNLCSSDRSKVARTVGDQMQAFTTCSATKQESPSKSLNGDSDPAVPGCHDECDREELAIASLPSEHVKRSLAATRTCFFTSERLPAAEKNVSCSSTLSLNETSLTRPAFKVVDHLAASCPALSSDGSQTTRGPAEASQTVEATVANSSVEIARKDGGTPPFVPETPATAGLQCVPRATAESAPELESIWQGTNSFPFPASAAACAYHQSSIAYLCRSPPVPDTLPVVAVEPDGTGDAASASLSGGAGPAVERATIYEAESCNAVAVTPPSDAVVVAAAVVSTQIPSASAGIQPYTLEQKEMSTGPESSVPATTAPATGEDTGAVAPRYGTRQSLERSNGQRQHCQQQLQKNCFHISAAVAERDAQAVEHPRKLRRGGGRGAERGGGRSGLLRREGRADSSSGLRSSHSAVGRDVWQTEAAASGGKKAQCAAADAACNAGTSREGMQTRNPRRCCCSGEWQQVPRQRGWASKEKGRYAQIVYLHPKPVILVLMPGSFSFKSERRPKAELVEEALEVLAKMHGKIQAPVAAFVSRWGRDPFARGSYSYLPPGSTGRDYDILSYPVSDRLLFAGEHTMRPYPSTVHGACLSGKREADRVVEWVTGSLKRSSLFKWFHSEGDDQWFPMGIDEMDAAPSYFEDILEGPESIERCEWFAGSVTCGFCGEPQTLERPFIGCISIPLPLADTLFHRPRKKAVHVAAHSARHDSSNGSTSSNCIRGTTDSSGPASSSIASTRSTAGSSSGSNSSSCGRRTTHAEKRNEGAHESNAATAASEMHPSSHAESSGGAVMTDVSRLRVAVHEDCSYHTPAVVSNNEGSRWFNVGRAVAIAAITPCCCCGKPGASVPCAAPTCSNAAHVPCAKRLLHWPRYRMGRFAYPLYCIAHQSLLPHSLRRSMSVKGTSAAAAAARKKLRRRHSHTATHFTCSLCGSRYVGSSGKQTSENIAATAAPVSSHNSGNESLKAETFAAEVTTSTAPATLWCPQCTVRNQGTKTVEGTVNKAEAGKRSFPDAAVAAARSAAVSAAAAAAAYAAVALSVGIRRGPADFVLAEPSAGRLDQEQQQQGRLRHQSLQQQHHDLEEIRQLTDTSRGDQSRGSIAALDRYARSEERNDNNKRLVHRERDKSGNPDIYGDHLFINALCQDPAWQRKDSERAFLLNVRNCTRFSCEEAGAAAKTEFLDTTRPFLPARPVILPSRAPEEEVSRIRHLSAIQNGMLDHQQQLQRSLPKQQQLVELRLNCMLRQRLRSPQQPVGMLSEGSGSAMGFGASARQERQGGVEEGSDMKCRIGNSSNNSAQAYNFVRQVQLVVEQLELVKSTQNTCNDAALLQQHLPQTATDPMFI